jgi:hypothetical protein
MSDKIMSGPFEGLLGNNCELRMLEYLLPLEGIEFNITELAEEVGVSRVTATRIIKKFVEWGVLKSPRTVGNAAYYSINHESPVVKSVEQFNNVLIEKILGDETLYEIHDYWEAQRPCALTLLAAGEIPQQRGVLLWSDSFGAMRGSPPNPWGREETSKQFLTCATSSTVCGRPGEKAFISGGII